MRVALVPVGLDFFRRAGYAKAVLRSYALLFAACLLAAACRTTYKAVKGTTKVAVGTVEFAGKTTYKTGKLAVAIVKDFGYYAGKAAQLRHYHESQALDSSQLARVGGGRRGKYHKLPAYDGGYRWPLSAGIVSSEFGHRWGKNHEGIDIAADSGEPVYASADGQVEYAGDGLRGYGNVVIVRHDRKTTTLYAHNSKLNVKAGDEVRGGQTIALLGSTGHSTGPHVHFEIRRDRVAENPRSDLPKSRF
jgi:murein DD-endopeptidase MepM/ murein hydrolase activator NlpD